MGLNLLTFSNLTKHRHELLHFSSTRLGGVSVGSFSSLNLGNYSDDNPRHVDQNRQRLCEALSISPTQLITVHQVHGSEVLKVDASLAALSPSEREAATQGYDAMICNIPNVCIAVTTADCVPVLLYDPLNKVVGAVHSGWRGTVQNIVGKTIDRMHEWAGSRPSDLIAAIAPCISVEHYEVGAEVMTLFQTASMDVSSIFKVNGDHIYLDLKLAVLQQLKEKQVLNTEVSPYCTYAASDLFFSARRQGIHSGRMLSGIGLIEQTHQ
ncbi:MAG: peptidoglycan editing factor PgeF [Microbacter sp.]